MSAGSLPLARQLPRLLIVLLALLLCTAGVAMTLAGVARYQAEAFLQDWQGKAVEPEDRAWQVAAKAAQRAVAWYPVANGDYLDRLGRVHSWRFYQQPYGSAVLLTSLPLAQAAVIEASRRQALAAYRASVEVRPGWPDSWARLVHAKLYLLELDGEFEQAFLRAADQGPWRGAVNLELAEIGLTAWGVMPADARERTVVQAARAMLPGGADSLAVQGLARQAGVELRICAAMDKIAPTSQGKCL